LNVPPAPQVIPHFEDLFRLFDFSTFAYDIFPLRNIAISSQAPMKNVIA